MALAVGSRLGFYEVVGLLGAGGMGEVYRADDASLDRQVAKVLPEAVRADPDRVARFELEAKLLGSLPPKHREHPRVRARQDEQVMPANKKPTPSRQVAVIRHSTNRALCTPPSAAVPFRARTDC